MTWDRELFKDLQDKDTIDIIDSFRGKEKVEYITKEMILRAKQINKDLKVTKTHLEEIMKEEDYQITDQIKKINCVGDSKLPTVTKTIKEMQEQILEKEDQNIIKLFDKVEENSFLNRSKKNLVHGGYRVAGKKIAKITKSAITSLLRSKNYSNSDIKLFNSIMESEFGNAIISLVLGVAFTKINNVHAQKIADDMQIDGFAIAGEKAFDMVLSGVMPELLPILGGLPPKAKKLRIKKVVEVEEVEEVEIEEQKKEVL